MLVERYKAHEFHTLSPVTQKFYGEHLKQFAIFAHNRALSPQLVTDFMAHIATKWKQFERIKYAMRKFLRWANSTGLTTRPLHELIKIKKWESSGKQTTFTEEEYERLKFVCSEKPWNRHWYYVTVICYRTGMGFRDACLLKWANIDRDKCVITYIPHRQTRVKREAICPYPVGGDLHELLEQLWAIHVNNEYICPSIAEWYNGSYYKGDKRKLRRMLERYSGLMNVAGLKRNGLNIRSLRSSRIKRLVDSGVPWPAISAVTGHSSYSMFLKQNPPPIETLRKELEKVEQKDVQVPEQHPFFE